MQIHAERIIKIKKHMNEILSERTGQPIDVITADTERDNFMSAEQAKAYGLIDEVITRKDK